MKKMLFFCAFVTVVIPLCFADSNQSLTIENAVTRTKEEINEQTEVLTKLRNKILNEKIPLSKNLIQLEAEVKILREEFMELKSLEKNIISQKKKLENELQYTSEEIQFISGIISEFRKNIFKGMSLAEELYIKKSLDQADELLLKPEVENKIDTFRILFQQCMKKFHSHLGGALFDGSCLSSNGDLIKGRFIEGGPVSIFYSDKSKISGLSGLQVGSFFPVLGYPISQSTVSSLLNGKVESIPVDITGGNALKLSKIQKNLFEQIKSGGIIMVPILLLGFFCLIMSVWKWHSLSHIASYKEDVLPEIFDNLNKQQTGRAKKIAEELKAPSGPVLLEGIENSHLSREELEEIMHEKIMLQIPFLEKGLAVLSVSAASAPLLGLLGTVTGMIHTFNLVTVFGTGKANLLSSGISEALITTEYGLIIAIPALLIHAYYTRRVKGIIHSMEQMTVSFINGIKIKTT